ncbi:zinc finger protein 771 isoform X1 [Aedes albopictus]|uniref:C2h2-type zn-finger protein n=1 Tax=Aedes albopictus TaxID=7160 RepID=A0ABM1XJD7_AEDAL
MNAGTTVCRLCLKENHDTKSNHDDYSNKSGDPLEESLEQLVSQYLPIQIIKYDDSDYPFICSCCTSKIKQWHRFCTSCIDNDKIYMQRFLEQLTSNGRMFHQEEVMLPKEEMLDTFCEEITTDLYVEIEPADENESIGDPNDEICDDQNYYPLKAEMPNQQEPKIEDNEVKLKETEEVESAPKKPPKCPKKTPKSPKETPKSPKKTPKSPKKKKRKRPDDGLNLFLRKPCTRVTPKGEKPERRVAEMCPMCGKFVKDLKGHMGVHIDDRRYQCPHCPKTFVARNNFQNHVNIHTRAKMYKCDHCPKEFTLRNVLVTHLATHTKELKYVCPVCDKAFYQRTTFARHKRAHFAKRTVKCTECDRMFLSNGEMKHHFRKHLPVRPYPCTVCPQAFYRSSNLKVHMKIHERKKTDSIAIEVMPQDAYGE